MTPEQAVERLQTILAHAWMVRAFLKHSEEIADEEDLLDVHRTIFDYIRSTEPAFQRGDVKEFLHRIKAKLSKLRKAAEHFAKEYRRVSDHTNFHMASASLTACVKEIEAVLAALKAATPPRESPGHEGDPEREGEAPAEPVPEEEGNESR
jgi:hypothetical protein